MENQSEKDKEIILRTEAVNEILSAPPKWIIRWGISIVFMLIMISLLLASFIRYPDTLVCKATLTSVNPAITIITKNSGKITQLLVKNNQVINENTVLAVLENTANYVDILAVENDISKIGSILNTSDSLLPTTTLNNTLNLGTVTPVYLQFLKSYKDYILFIETNLQSREIRILNKDITEYYGLLKKHQGQIDLSQQEFNLIEKDFQRDESLYQSKVISSKEYDDKKRSFIVAKRNLESQKIALTNTKILINNIEKNILQLQIQQYDQLSRLKQDLKQNLQALEHAINEWKQNYLVQTPINGKVSFFNYWSVNQNITAGDELFSIVPQQEQKVIAKLLLPANNSGKAKTGQMVNIKLEDFPYLEYGMIRGTVTNISLVPNKNNYLIDVMLNDGMRSNYNKTIKYKPEMQGQADIITDNKTVLQRIFFQFKKLISK